MAISVSPAELYRVVATAIIYKDRKYLLVKRSEKEKVFAGKWTVPGGGMHPDDYVNLPPSFAGQWYWALDVSLRRELKEEVNLTVGKLEYLLNYVFVRPDKIHVAGFSYFAKIKSGKIKLEENLTDFSWVTARQAKKYDLIPGILDEILLLDKILSSSKKQVRAQIPGI